jgi:hypothetical protein
MNGKLPIDRVREQEHANQPKKDSAKKRVADDQAAIERRARVYDDDAATRALEAGEAPGDSDAKD